MQTFKAATEAPNPHTEAAPDNTDADQAEAAFCSWEAALVPLDTTTYIGDNLLPLLATHILHHTEQPP